MGRSALRYAAATRALPGESANGDRWLVAERDGALTVLVVDGLGHGEDAAAAAEAAVAAARERAELGPVELIQLCDRPLRGTRGAGASAMRIEDDRAVFAGIGNVEGRIVQGGLPDKRWSPDRGVLGRGIREPHLIGFPLSGEWTVLLHTDGVTARFEFSEVSHDLSADAMAEDVLARWGRQTDDATVVVVRSGG